MHIVTADGRMYALSEPAIASSPVLMELRDSCGDDACLPVHDFDGATVEVLLFLAQQADSMFAMLDDRYADLSDAAAAADKRAELVALANLADFLSMDAVLDAVGEVLADRIAGLTSEEIRTLFSVPSCDALTPERMRDITLAHPWAK